MPRLSDPVEAANKALVVRYYDDLWNQWDVSIAEELIVPDITFQGSLGRVVHGREQFLSYMTSVKSAFSDFHNTVEELIAEGDKVVARLTYRGTHLGEVLGVAPT
jgi:predicted ester cyclase